MCGCAYSAHMPVKLVCARHTHCKCPVMAGITNHPESLEDENQERVERRKSELLHSESVDKSRKDPSAIESDRAQDVPAGKQPVKHIGLGPNHEGPKAP
jgi:hypothetical protein